MKDRSLPVLAVGWILSIAIAGASLYLARLTTLRRIPSDPEVIRHFATSVESELNRLEKRYEARIASIFRKLRNGDLIAAGADAKSIYGLESISTLYPEGSIGKDSILVAGKPEVGFAPPLTFRPDESDRKHLLEESDFFEESFIAKGWFTTESEPRLHYWERRGNANVLVASIDPRVTRKSAIYPWLSKTQRIDRSLLDGFRGTLQIESVEGEFLWELPDREPGPPRPPDHVFPVKNVFGTWTIVARDPVEKVSEWRWPVLIGGMVLAFALALAATRFASAYRKTSELAERRVSFVNQASHELRSPITNILLHADLAAEAVHDNDSAGAQKRIGLIREEGSRLSRLVDNVLTFSLKERDAFQYAVSLICPDKVIEQVIGNFEPSLRRKGIIMETSLNAADSFRTDRDALSQIVTNLISNVEKYAASGKWIGLETRIERHDETARLIVLVSDRGPGIPVGHARKIFRPFERLSDEVSEGVSGTGLGLPIARDLALGLRGELRLRDSNSGASFELSLPESS